jgi:hypothetical protein
MLGDIEMDFVWDGITRAETVNDWAGRARQELADAAKAYQIV